PIGTLPNWLPRLESPRQTIGHGRGRQCAASTGSVRNVRADPRPVLVLDSGAITRLSTRSPREAALISELRAQGLWPPLVPTPALVESLTGHSGRDANTNRLLEDVRLGRDVVGASSPQSRSPPHASAAGFHRRSHRRGSG